MTGSRRGSPRATLGPTGASIRITPSIPRLCAQSRNAVGAQTGRPDAASTRTCKRQGPGSLRGLYRIYRGCSAPRLHALLRLLAPADPRKNLGCRWCNLSDRPCGGRRDVHRHQPQRPKATTPRQVGNDFPKKRIQHGRRGGAHVVPEWHVLLALLSLDERDHGDVNVVEGSLVGLRLHRNADEAGLIIRCDTTLESEKELRLTELGVGGKQQSILPMAELRPLEKDLT